MLIRKGSSVVTVDVIAEAVDVVVGDVVAGDVDKDAVVRFSLLLFSLFQLDFGVVVTG